MDGNTFHILTEQWSSMTGRVLDLKKIPQAELQCLLKDTYKVLHFYCQDGLVPRVLGKVLLEMEDFLYFTSIMENQEVEADFYCYQIIHTVVKALETGFFQGAYECAFPMLKLVDPMGNLHILDLENGSLEELL